MTLWIKTEILIIEGIRRKKNEMKLILLKDVKVADEEKEKKKKTLEKLFLRRSW